MMPSVPEVPDSILQTAALRCPERPWKMELRIAVLASGSRPKQSVHWTMARANSDTLLSRQGLQVPVMPRIADYHPIRGSAYSSGNGRQAAEHSQNTPGAMAGLITRRKAGVSLIRKCPCMEAFSG